MLVTAEQLPASGMAPKKRRKIVSGLRTVALTVYSQESRVHAGRPKLPSRRLVDPGYREIDVFGAAGRRAPCAAEEYCWRCRIVGCRAVRIDDATTRA